jgi:hypothetical protein
MKVKIKKWSAVATWRWDLPEDDVCGICQNHFDATCPGCKYPGDECSLCRPHYSVVYLVTPSSLTTALCSIWKLWPQLPYGGLHSALEGSQGKLTTFSIALGNGLRRSRPKASVLCADRVSAQTHAGTSVMDAKHLVEFDWNRESQAQIPAPSPEAQDTSV